MYLGMHKGTDKGSFYNERFLRGMPFLSKKLKRVGGAKVEVDATINTSQNYTRLAIYILHLLKYQRIHQTTLS